MSTAEQQHFNTAEAAAYLGVSIATIRRWTDSGILPCWRTPGGQRRFTKDELDRWRQERSNQDG